MAELNWRPGIGDPTIGGWVTVILYFLAVVSTWKTASVIYTPNEKALWLLICLMFIALGINKQLDLQTAFTEIGRIVAIKVGWYNERRIVQIWFVVGVAITCALIGLGLLLLARDVSFAAQIALVGMVMVFAFVLIRAASFHHIDRFIRASILGLKWNWVLEIGGTSIVLLSSEWLRRHS